MKVIVSLIDDKWRFFVLNKKQFLLTSTDIAEKFSIPLEEYEKRVINKVLKHKNAKVIFTLDFSKRNVVFENDNTPEEYYVERFKEEFSEELILLELSEEGVI